MEQDDYKPSLQGEGYKTYLFLRYYCIAAEKVV